MNDGRAASRTRLSRLPLRFRLVLGFSAATLVVLLGAGAFVYWRVADALDRDLDTDVSQAAETIGPLVGPDGHVANRPPADATGSTWQILDARGAVVDSGGPAAAAELVNRERLRSGSTTVFDVGALLPISAHPYRVRLTPLGTAPAHVLVVAVRRDHRDEALRELMLQLAIAGIGTLVVTAFVGERLARAALRPVDRYRQRAAEIAEGRTSLRLDVPFERDDEITRLGHTLNEMLTALDAAVARERQFVADASHELRTPIALLSGRLQLASLRPRSVDEHERVVAELSVDVNRLARLADQLLALGAVDPADTQRACDAAAVARHVVDLLDGPDGHVAVSGVESGAVIALADLECERLLTNLLDNARVHGAPPISLAVDLADNGWVRIVVRDFGAGMRPDLLDTATRRFVRSDEARSRPGAGLGLSLADALVASAGGELRLCHAGHHAYGRRRSPIECEHGPEMTATVLLPRHAGAAGLSPAP